MNNLYVASIARHVLTTAGGVLVAKGTIDETSATALAGALSTLIGLAWSFFDKKKR